MTNPDDGYGRMTKLLHWIIFLLVLNQFIVAVAMLRTTPAATLAGFSQGTLNLLPFTHQKHARERRPRAARH